VPYVMKYRLTIAQNHMDPINSLEKSDR